MREDRQDGYRGGQVTYGKKIDGFFYVADQVIRPRMYDGNCARLFLLGQGQRGSAGDGQMRQCCLAQV